MSILISCVVLSYNGGNSLIRTLESCRLQTYLHKELVIADDASTDADYTVSLIEKWLDSNNKFFQNVIFIKNKTNMGTIKNLRNAACHAHGDIIFSLGQGDLVYGPDTLANIVSEIEYHNNLKPLIWLGYYRSYSINEKVNIIDNTDSLPYQLDMLTNNRRNIRAVLKRLIRGGFIGAPSIVFTKRYFLDFPEFPAYVTYAEDFMTLFYLIINGMPIGRLNLFVRWYEKGTGVSSHPTLAYQKAFFLQLDYVTSILQQNDDIQMLAKDVMFIKKMYTLIFKELKLDLKTKIKLCYLHPILFAPLFLRKLINCLIITFYIPYFTRKIGKISSKPFKIDLLNCYRD